MYAMQTPAPGTEAPLSGNQAVLVGLGALAVVTIPFLWPLVEQFNAMAHEGAHAVVGSVMGFGIKSVELHIDNTGETGYKHAPDIGPRRTLTRFIGYLGPSGFGLWAAKLIETGHVVAVLWIAIILLVLLLFVIRKSFGLASVPAAIALMAVATRYTYDGREEVIVYGITWLLLLSGVRVAYVHGVDAKDAENLSRTTYIPRRIWALLWLVGTLLAVAIGGKWLVLRS
jgi:Peptidase M50B-like